MLSETPRGIADSFARTALQISPKVLLPGHCGQDRPNVQVCRYCCRIVLIFASVPPSLGMAQRWSGGASSWTGNLLLCSCHLLFLCLPLRRLGARAERELDCCCYCPTGQGLRLPSRHHVMCEELELDGCCHYPASYPAADFGPGPEVVAEGRAAAQGICFSPFCTTHFGRIEAGPEAAAKGCAAVLGICLLLQPTSGLARRQRRRGSLRDGESAFHQSLSKLPTTSGLAQRRW